MMSGPTNSNDLRVPKDKMQQFQSEKEEILKESLQMMLDDKATGVDKSKFPPPARMAAIPEAKAKRTTTSTRVKHTVKHKTAVKSKSAAKKRTVAKKTSTTAKKNVSK
jgi:membrane-bound lytic murein transglycosylase D